MRYHNNYVIKISFNALAIYIMLSVFIIMLMAFYYRSIKYVRHIQTKINNTVDYSALSNYLPLKKSYEIYRQYYSKDKINDLEECDRMQYAILTYCNIKDSELFIKNNYRMFMKKHQHKIIIFNNQNTTTKKYKNLKYDLIDISKYLNDTLSDVYPIGYNNMEKEKFTVFFFRQIFTLKELCNIKYYLRIKCNSTITISNNPFKVMDNRYYMYDKMFYTNNKYASELKEFLKEYIKVHSLRIMDKGKWDRSFVGNNIGAYNMDFEIVKMSFFLKPEVQELINIIYYSNEIFTKKWELSSLRYLILSIFSVKKNVLIKTKKWIIN